MDTNDRLSFRAIHLLTPWLFALGMALASCWPASGLYANEGSRSIALSINDQHNIPINLKKYGINGALLGSTIGYGSKELEDIYKSIGITFNRFPGGTIGNYYQWESGRFSCDIPYDASTSRRIKRMNRTLDRTQTTYNVDDFFGFMKNTNGDFTYVLNTMCDSAESNANLLKHMANQNVDLNFLEMANETYSNSYAWAYSHNNEYLDSAIRNYSAVKQYYPNAKVGLVVSPASFNGKYEPAPYGTPNSSWPARASQFDTGAAHASFADGLIIHIYGHPYDGRFWSLDPKSDQDYYRRSISQFNNKFKISMSYLKQLGQGKAIWITEWGVSAPAESRLGKFRKYKKSAFQALYMASALTSISLEKDIEIANYHSAGDLWETVGSKVRLTPIADVLALFIASAKQAKQVHPVQIEAIDAGGSNRPGNIRDLKSLLFASEQAGDLFIINEGINTYMINGLDLGQKEYTRYSTGTLTIENNKFNPINEIERETTDIVRYGITLRPFSVTRIKLH